MEHALSIKSVRPALLVALLLVLSSVGCKPKGYHDVLPVIPTGGHFLLAPEEVHYGGTYAEWGQRWWQWAMELPLTNHPLFDATGEHAAEGQIDPVWFLGGRFNGFNQPPLPPGPTLRDITIPSGVALFFPLVNIEWDNELCLPADWVDISFTEMRARAAEAIEGTLDLQCVVDGEVILQSPTFVGAERFRAQSPSFSLWLPPDNMEAALCDQPVIPLFVSPIASDGIWVMLAPLPPGPHTLQFGGTFPGAPPFVLDIRYNITVLPETP